jgi:hypothetical protein
MTSIILLVAALLFLLRMSVNQQYSDQVLQPNGTVIQGVVSPVSSTHPPLVPPLSQSHIDAFQQLQQRSIETIRSFTTQPIVSTNNRNARQSQPGDNSVTSTATTDATPRKTIATHELYSIEYSKDVCRKWAADDTEASCCSQEDSEVEEDNQRGEEPRDGGEDMEEEGDDSSRSPLFGGTRPQQQPQRPASRRQRARRSEYSADDEEDDTDEPPSREERSHSNNDGRRRRRRRDDWDGDDDDNPRPRKRYSTKHRNECFLCGWGNKYHDGIDAPHVNKLIEIIDTNYGVHHNREIANEMHLYFKYEVYDPASGMQMLTREVALEHIEGMHSLNAKIFLGESIRQEKQLSFLFLNAIWRPDQDTPGAYSYDKIAADQYRKSQKALRELYLMPLNKMNFSNGNGAEDLKRQANHMNLMMPRFDQRKPKKAVARQPRAGSNAPANSTSVPPIRRRFG